MQAEEVVTAEEIALDGEAVRPEEAVRAEEIMLDKMVMQTEEIVPASCPAARMRRAEEVAPEKVFIQISPLHDRRQPRRLSRPATRPAS